MSPSSFVVDLAAAFVNWHIWSLPDPIEHADICQRLLLTGGKIETDFLLSVPKYIELPFLVRLFHLCLKCCDKKRRLTAGNHSILIGFIFVEDDNNFTCHKLSMFC